MEALRRANAEIMLDRIAQVRPLAGARLLDVGCAKGWFLGAARDRGVLVHGIEPDAAHVTDARAAGLDVAEGFFPRDLGSGGPYDIIVFNDVFEHLPAPEQAIRDVARLLEPGGLAIVNLPSSTGVLYRIATVLDRLGMPTIFERMWQKDLPSPHLSYFSPDSLRGLVERYSPLREVQRFALPSYAREGLGERIAMTHRGVTAFGLHAGLWCLSFALPLLPADIHVGVFRKAG